MKEKQIQSWIDKNLNKLVYINGLEAWDIQVKIKTVSEYDLKCTNGCTQAEVSELLFEYKSAKIILFSESIDSIKEIPIILQHELFHILLSPYDMLLESIHYTRKKKFTELEHEYILKTHELAVAALEKREARIR